MRATSPSTPQPPRSVSRLRKWRLISRQESAWDVVRNDGVPKIDRSGKQEPTMSYVARQPPLGHLVGYLLQFPWQSIQERIAPTAERAARLQEIGNVEGTPQGTEAAVARGVVVHGHEELTIAHARAAQ